MVCHPSSIPRYLGYVAIPLLMTILQGFFASTVQAQQSSLSVTVNRETISVRQTVSANVVVKLAGVVSQARLIEPSWSDNGWRVLGRSQVQQMNWINGSRSLEVTYTYQLRPKRLGQLKVGPFKGSGSAEGLESNTVTITVSENAPQESEEEAKLNELYAKALWNIGQSEVWLGERIEASLSVYVLNQLRLMDLTVPDIDLQGFWAEELEIPRRSPRVELQGRIYSQTMIKRDLLAPLKAGKLQLPQIDMEVVIGTMSIFSERQSLTVKTEPITIKVKPLPPNAPAEFRGPAVGEVKIESSLDRSKVREGSGIQYTVRTFTTGVIANTPEIELPYLDGIKAFPPTTRTTKQEIAGRTRSVRIQTWLLKPERSGRFSIPSIKLHYFDPRTGEYEIAQSRSHRLVVQPTPGKGRSRSPQLSSLSSSQSLSQPSQGQATSSATEQLGVQLRSIINAPLSGDQQPWPVWIWWLIGVFGPLVLFLTEGWQLLQRLSQRNSGDRAAARAGKQALRDLEALDEKQFDYAALDDLIATYLETKLKRSFRGLTREQTTAQLTDLGLSYEIVESYRGLLEEADFARFAPGSSSDQSTQVKQLARHWLKLCDQQLSEPPSSISAKTSVSLLLLVLLSLPTLAHGDKGSPSDQSLESTSETGWAASGNHAFWSGDYVSAVRHYRVSLERNPYDAGLWYNLGTVLAHRGLFGQAAYALERAALIEPSSDLIHDQRTRVHQAVIEEGTRRPGKRRLILPDEISSSGGLLSLFTLSGLRALCLSMLSICCLLIVSLRRKMTATVSHHTRRDASIRALCLVTGILVLFSGSAWWLKQQATQRHRGVVTSNRAPLYRGPGDQYQVEANIAGAVKLELQGERASWQRVRLSDGREGWMAKSDLKSLRINQ